MTKVKAEVKEAKVVEVSFIFEGKLYKQVLNDFTLSEVSLAELKEALNQVSGRFTYWSSVLGKLERKLNDFQLDYDVWYAKIYLKIDSDPANKGKTETFKKNEIIKLFEEKFRAFEGEKYSIREAISQCLSIVKGFDKQSFALKDMVRLAAMELGQLGDDSVGNKNLENL